MLISNVFIFLSHLKYTQKYMCALCISCVVGQLGMQEAEPWTSYMIIQFNNFIFQAIPYR
jgi:hypothetical protein